jgi:phage terminase small subunit
MLSELTLKQRKFAGEYLDTGNATEAADRAYKPKNRNTAHAIGAENLRKPTIRAFLDGKAQDAASMVYKLSRGAESEYVRLAACKDILDRAGYFVDKNVAAEKPVVTAIQLTIAPEIAEQNGIRESIRLGMPEDRNKPKFSFG